MEATPTPNSPQAPQIWFAGQFLQLQDLRQGFNPKLEQLIGKKALKFALLDNCLYYPFTEAQIQYWKPFNLGLGRFLER